MSKNFTVQKILGVLLHRLPFILLSGVVAGMIFFIYTSVAIKPVYSTSSMIYIQNYGKQQQQQTTTPQDKGEETTAPAATKASSGTSDASESNNDKAQKIFNSDLSGSAALASSCVILFQNDPEVTEMYHGCNVSMKVENDNSFFITISVSGTNAKDCKTTADNVAIRCSEVFNKYFPYGKTGTIRAAGDAGQVSPNKVQNTLVGVAVGLVFAIIVAILLEMIDTTIKNDDDLAAMYKIPVFAEIPDFENQGR